MYDKFSNASVTIAKNTEALDIDPTELIKRDWGFSRLRIWAVKDMNNGMNEKSRVVQIDESMLKTMERTFSQSSPFTFNS